MTIYTYSQARQNFSEVLERASTEGEVQILKRDGSLFSIVPQTPKKRSPFDVKGVKVNIGVEQLVEIIRESRERNDDDSSANYHR